MTLSGFRTLCQQVLSCYIAICKVYICNMINYLPVCFLRYSLIKASVTSFHVKDRDMAFLSCNSAKAGVSIAKNQKGIWLNFFKHRINIYQYLACCGRCVSPAAFRK